MANQVGVAENLIRPQRGDADAAHARQPEGTKVRLHALLLLLLSHHSQRLRLETTGYWIYVAAQNDSCYFLPKTCLRIMQKSSTRPSIKQLTDLPTVQGGLTRLAANRLRKAGVKLEPLLSGVGLTVDQINDPEQRITAR